MINLKVISFVFSEKDVLKLKKLYGNNLSLIRNFAITDEAYNCFRSVGIKPLNYESYFPKKRSDELNDTAGKWAKNWYKEFGINFDYKGINVVSLLELSLHNFFAKKLYQYIAISELIKIEKPDVIMIGDEQPGLKNILVSNFEVFTPIIKCLAKHNNLEIRFLNKIKDFSSNLLKLVIQLLLVPKISLPFTHHKKADFLFVGHHYHLQNIFELLRILNKKKGDLLVVGRLGNTKKLLKQENINSLDIRENRSINIFDNLPVKMRSLVILNQVKRQDLTKYFEIDGESIYDILKPKIFSILIHDCAKLINIIRAANDLINKIEPEILICISADSSIQSFVKVAQSMKLPTLEIQHGFTVGSDSKYILADKLAVWGNIPRGIYAKDIASKRLFVTGWPAFEIYKRRKSLIRKFPSRPTVTFLAQDPEGMSLLFSKNTPRENLKIFFESTSKLENPVNIIVRLHPRANKSFVEDMAKIYGLHFKYSSNKEALIDLLGKTDIVVGQDTSAIFDAIIVHKPVIYLPSMRWPAKFVGESGAVFEVNDSVNLSKVINTIIDNGITKKMIFAQEKFIEEYCNFSQNSVNNVSSLIYEMEKNTI